MRADKQRNKKRIIEKAGIFVAQNDIDSVSLEEIAAAADVTRATIYNHFSSKEDLLKEMLMPALDYITKDLEARNRKLTTDFSDITSSLFELYSRHKQTVELAACQTLSKNIDVNNAHRKFIEQFQKLMISARPEGYPLGLDLSMKIISRIYLPVLIELSSTQDLNNKDILKFQFNKIIQGALCL